MQHTPSILLEDAYEGGQLTYRRGAPSHCTCSGERYACASGDGGFLPHAFAWWVAVALGVPPTEAYRRRRGRRRTGKETPCTLTPLATSLP